MALASDGTALEDLRLVPAFPLTHPDEAIEVRGPDGASIGMIRALADLDAASRKAAETALAAGGAALDVLAVRSVRNRGRRREWLVDTPAGPFRFLTSARESEALTRLPRGCCVLASLEGGRFRLELGRLDPESRRRVGSAF